MEQILAVTVVTVVTAQAVHGPKECSTAQYTNAKVYSPKTLNPIAPKSHTSLLVLITS